MVAGGAAMIPESIFDSVRPMPASIAAESGGGPLPERPLPRPLRHGIVLFFLTLGFNLIADYVSNKFKEVGSGTL
jgi:phosphate transport system permease protein